MYATTFVRIVEEEYSKIFNDAQNLKRMEGFDLSTKPSFICEKVQKFRSWLTIAIRCAELVHNGAGIKPEDALIDAASARYENSAGKPMHPSILSALSLFDKAQFDGIFGETRRLILEQSTKSRISECRFQVCYSHCRYIKNIQNEGSYATAPTAQLYSISNV